MEDKRDISLISRLRDMQESDFFRIQRACTFFSIVSIVGAFASLAFYIQLTWFGSPTKSLNSPTFFLLLFSGILFVHGRSGMGLNRLRRIIRHLAREANERCEGA